MKKCDRCQGEGYLVVGQRPCPNCEGTGKSESISLGESRASDIDDLLSRGSAQCSVCKGTGNLPVTEACQACAGLGREYLCLVCGARLTAKAELCEHCSQAPLVYVLDPACDTGDLVVGDLYQGKVSGLASFGAFVDLNGDLRGLAHNKYLKSRPEVGDTIYVRVRSIAPNGNIELEPAEVGKCHILTLEKDLSVSKAKDLSQMMGKLVCLKGEVIQVKQTGGPTIFTIADESGVVSCAAFERAGVRAYAEIDSDMVVKIVGEASTRNGQIQVEIRSMKQLFGGEATEVRNEIEQSIDRRAEPADPPLLVESDIMTRLRPRMRAVAKEIRRAIFKSRPIVLRHHADADGISSAVAVESAILPLIREVGGPDAEYFSYRRAPSKAPFYELEDVTKDLTYALEDQSRHGQKMPLVVLMDNGSTEEDVPAMKQAQVYGLEMLVVDHHHPNDVVDQYLIAHVNPAQEGGDFGITTGMLGVEIARMINPDVGEKVIHLAAISAVGDRSEAKEAALYIKLVEDRFKTEDLKRIALALDYEAFWLRFNEGRGLINDILCLGRLDRHRRIVDLLCEQANAAIEDQLRASLGNVKSTKLPNGIIMNVLDVENFAHKFTFPPPGKTSGEVHDRMCQKFAGKPVVTIGYGPDFAVLRSRGVGMNIPQMVKELMAEIPNGGVSGGGHLVVGSIKFVGGMRKDVLAKLAEKISACPVDEVIPVKVPAEAMA
ncbi:MAG TPA: DHH family phosphoesterase [Methanotrichaceae archaeon]|nr:DHH family phosphoesterase [Methanotrichaceae archaeon]HQF17681.1 DHH family phosphoesterase [Methanotrichaceae archaeon]HQI92284.1 DHH family phosphoesterase [Methanotrichaceae archaeon]HQJ29387.1 DHH family phosphoesterase [Methanotrichaceae archaeon]